MDGRVKRKFVQQPKTDVVSNILAEAPAARAASVKKWMGDLIGQMNRPNQMNTSCAATASADASKDLGVLADAAEPIASQKDAVHAAHSKKSAEDAALHAEAVAKQLVEETQANAKKAAAEAEAAIAKKAAAEERAWEEAADRMQKPLKHWSCPRVPCKNMNPKQSTRCLGCNTRAALMIKCNVSIGDSKCGNVNQFCQGACLKCGKKIMVK